MKQSLKEKRDLKYVNLQKESAKYTNNNIKSNKESILQNSNGNTTKCNTNKVSNRKMTKSKQTSIENLLINQQFINNNLPKQKRNFDQNLDSQGSLNNNLNINLHTANGNLKLTSQESSRSYYKEYKDYDQLSKNQNIASTKDVSTDKESNNTKNNLFYTGRKLQESIDSEENNKKNFRGHSLSVKQPKLMFDRESFCNRNRKNFYMNLQAKYKNANENCNIIVSSAKKRLQNDSNRDKEINNLHCQDRIPTSSQSDNENKLSPVKKNLSTDYDKSVDVYENSNYFNKKEEENKLNEINKINKINTKEMNTKRTKFGNPISSNPYYKYNVVNNTTSPQVQNSNKVKSTNNNTSSINPKSFTSATNNNITNNTNTNNAIVNINTVKEVSFNLKDKNSKSFLSKLDDNKKLNSNSEFFDYSESEKDIELTSEEKTQYGNREPVGYKKLRILGKGGCGIVFLCKNLSSNKDYAVKQISKKNKSESSIIDCKKEVEILELLCDKKINPEGSSYLLKLFEYIEDNQDMWLVFEQGGRSLGNLMFKIKGEFHNNERIYSIKKGRFYQHLFSKDANFKNFFRKLLESIYFMSCVNEVVHCDIKPDNILFDYDCSQDLDDDIDFSDMKLIDFGSAFKIENPDNFSSNTPEYMPPEITELIERKASSKEIYNFLKNFDKYPYAVDVWSLGVMILEILLCCPVWMSYKAKTMINGRVSFKP